jgi:energy-converting hydrogenase Eha subunit A
MKRAIAPATAIVAWAAVLVQMVLSIQNSMARGDSFLHATVDYFAYFTVLTNVLVALVLTVPWLAPESPLGKWLARPHMTAMTATAIIIVGLTYHFLLSGSYDPVGIEYATDLGMHYLVPTLFTLYWVLAAPKAGLSYSHLPYFAIYPFGYLAFLVARGAVVSEYPYFFVDVNTLGFAVAARNAMGLVLIYFMIAALLLLITTKHRVKEDG